MFTEKDTYSLKNNIVNIFSTSIAKKALILSAVIFGFYIMFNLFAFFKLVDLADQELDRKIIHEIEHVDKFVDLVNDRLFFYSNREFEEDDFLTVTENAYFLQIYNSQGQVLFESPNMKEFGNIPVKFYSLDTGIKKDNVKYRDFDLRIVYRKLDNNEHVFVQLATPRKSVAAFIEEFEIFNLITLPVILVLIIVISFFLSKRVYLRLNKIIDLANEISAQNISKRIEFNAPKNDVYGRLKNTLNNLFNRLEKQVNQISNFSDNAAHQLLTPLTALKAEIEYINRNEHNIDEYKETLQIIHKETEKMIHLVKTLLLLAKDHNNYNDSRQVFNLTKLVVEQLNSKNYSNIKVNCGANIYVRGIGEYFKLVLENLVENAIKYSGNNNPIEIALEEIEEKVILTIKDNGPGIFPNEKEKIFERFYRGSNSEKNGIKGYGLGLSLVKYIVDSLNGEVKIEDNEPTGTVFRITLNTIKLM